MGSPDTDGAFNGSIPKVYDSLLAPLLFEPYAADLANRLRSRPLSHLLEIAARRRRGDPRVGLYAWPNGLHRRDRFESGDARPGGGGGDDARGRMTPSRCDAAPF